MSESSATLGLVMGIDRPATRGQIYDAFDAATRAIAGLQAVDDVLQVIVDRVRPLVGARYAALGIVDGGGAIDRFITSGIDDVTRARIGALPRGHGLLGSIIREDRSIRIPDIAIDDRRHGFPPGHPPMHSFLGVPVRVQGRSVGNLYLTEKADGQPFSAEDQRLVETFASHAAIAIENARLHAQVQRLAIVDERDRIGQDLHDGIIQSIYAVGLSLEDVPDLVSEDPDEVVRRVERAIDNLHLTIRDIRNLIFGLRPELLSGVSLEVGLAALVEEFRHNSMIDIELRTSTSVGDPPPDTTAHLLAIVNEALSNVARHSGASRAMVTLDDDERGPNLAITDNGRGFGGSPTETLGHQGLANMRSRADGIHATIEVETGHDGTTVRIILPVETEER